jgi:hypothetical protein
MSYKRTSISHLEGQCLDLDVLNQWSNIKVAIAQLKSSHEPRVINWSLTANIRFTTLSVYQMLERNISRAHNKGIWKSKLPLKIKIILWQLHQDVNCVNKR